MGTVYTNEVTLTVNALVTGPTIDTQPQNTTVDENTTANFTVAATTGGGALSYQWYLVGTGAMPGEIAAALSFTALEAQTGEQYYVEVTDDNGTTTSNTVTLTVTALSPTIDTQPVNLTVDENTAASFSVAATTSSGVLTYQWYLVGTGALAGEITDTLSFTALEAQTGEQYYVDVSDDNGTTTSNTVTLTVTALFPTIDTQPTPQTVTEGQNATFTVAATASAGGGILAYQWYDASDDSVIVGENAASIIIPTVLADNGNSYYVIVTDSNGITQSDTVALTVNFIVITLDGPDSQTVLDGQTVVLTTAVLTGNGPFTYQWYDSGGPLPGEITAQLDFTANEFSDGETYYVEVTNANETATSATATITIGSDLVPSPEDLARSALCWNFEDNNYTWFDAAVDFGTTLDNVPMMHYGVDPGWATRWDAAVLDGYTWASIQTPPDSNPWTESVVSPEWVDMYGRGNEENLYWATGGGVWKSDQYVKTDGVKRYFVERQQIDLDDMVPAWTTNNWKYTKQWYFHLQTPFIDNTEANDFTMQVGWADTMMDDPDYIPVQTINLQKRSNGGAYKWDYRSTGRYLSIYMTFDGTQEIRYTGADVDVEAGHGR